MRKLEKSIVSLSIFAGLAGCGPSETTRQKQGLTSKATTHLTCVDYSGTPIINNTFKDKSVTVKDGYVRVGSESTPDVFFTNGGGCLIVKNYFENPESMKEAQKTAPLYAAVTNSSDTVLLSGKYNKLSHSSADGTVTLTLSTAQGAEVQEVTTTGSLGVIANKSVEGFSKTIAEAAGFAPSPQQ